MKTKKASKIFWTTNEFELVAGQARYLRETAVEKLAWVEIVFRAQNVLPVDRRRPESSIRNAATDVSKFLKHLEEQSKLPPEVDTTESSIDNTILLPGGGEVGGPGLVVEETSLTGKFDGGPAVEYHDITRRATDRKPEAFETSLMRSMASLAGLFAAKFEDELMNQLEEAATHAIQSVDAKFQQRLKNARRAVSHVKSTLPKVLIVGLNGRQPEDIVEEFGDMLDLRFINSDESIKVLKSNAKFVDYVVLMTKFVSHSHQDAVREHEGLIMANGMVTNLKEVLLPIACC